MSKPSTTIRGFKGFDSKLRCNGKQYAVGKTSAHRGALSLCESGLHFCLRPGDCFRYYPASRGSRYCEIEAHGVSAETRDDDSKRVCRKMTVLRELAIDEMVGLALGSLTVGGWLDLRGTGITALPEGIKVDGEIYGFRRSRP